MPTYRRGNTRAGSNREATAVELDRYTSIRARRREDALAGFFINPMAGAVDPKPVDIMICVDCCHNSGCGRRRIHCINDANSYMRNAVCIARPVRSRLLELLELSDRRNLAIALTA
jgi:hypothetical protein